MLSHSGVPENKFAENITVWQVLVDGPEIFSSWLFLPEDHAFTNSSTSQT